MSTLQGSLFSSLPPSELITTSSVFTWHSLIFYWSIHLGWPCLIITWHLLPSRLWPLEDRVIFFFSLYPPQHLLEFLIHHRDSIIACWIELTGFALQGHLFLDWCLMGFPGSEALECVYLWWFSWIVSCPCPIAVSVPKRVVRKFCAAGGPYCIGSLHSL